MNVQSTGKSDIDIKNIAHRFDWDALNIAIKWTVNVYAQNMPHVLYKGWIQSDMLLSRALNASTPNKTHCKETVLGQKPKWEAHFPGSITVQTHKSNIQQWRQIVE